MTYHKNSLSIKISSIGITKIFDWGGGGGAKPKSHAVTASKIKKGGILWDRDAVEWKVRSWDLGVWLITMILLKGKTFNPQL